MPKTNQPPKYRKHKASGNAVVTINGKDNYLGPYGTAASRQRYDRLIAEYLSSGRMGLANDDYSGLTIAEMLLAYMRHAGGHYRKEGELTSEYTAMKAIVKVVRELYGETPAADFGPKKFEAVRQIWIDRPLTRQGINKNAVRLKNIFRWAGSKELIPLEVHQRLLLVENLRQYRTPGIEEAPEQQGVDLQIVERTIPHLSPVIADMVRIQLLTGCRPGEVCKLTPGGIDRSEDVWSFVVEHDKMQGKRRVKYKRTLYLGNEAQAILTPYLDRADDAYCFSPAENAMLVREQRRADRKTPLSCGNRAGTNRKQVPKRSPGVKYTAGAYRTAVKRVCRRIFKAPADCADAPAWEYQHIWCPQRLRHTRATDIRAQFGAEASQVILGHKSIQTTEIYAVPHHELAKEIMRRVG